MSLWNSVFAGRIVRWAIDRANGSLSGHAALELTSDFLRAALFEWISASPHNKRARANDRQGLHLFILGSERSNARAWLNR
jgi:hypothetical protein